MADSTTAIKVTLQHEGGFVDNPNDSGGATNMGIEQRDLPNIPIRSLTVPQAVAYYQENYWKKFYSQINDQTFATKLFDIGVLFGVGTAISLLETLLDVPIDGIFGPHDLQSVNDADPISLLAAYKTIVVTKALKIARDNPKDQVFVTGWINRINS